MNKTNMFVPNIETRIKEIAQKKGVSLQWIAEQIGMTKQGFYYMLNNKTIKVDVARKISELLQEPIINFFLHDSEVPKYEEKKSKDSGSKLAETLGLLIIAFAAYNYLKNYQDIIKKAKEDSNYTKDDILKDLESHRNKLAEILEGMEDSVTMNEK